MSLESDFHNNTISKWHLCDYSNQLNEADECQKGQEPKLRVHGQFKVCSSF